MVVLGLEDDVEVVARSGRFVAAHLVAVRRQRVPTIDAEPRVDRLVLPRLQRRRLSLQLASSAAAEPLIFCCRSARRICLMFIP